MQKWEYVRVRYVWIEKRAIVDEINDDRLKNNREVLPLTYYLNRLGEAGWELVTVYGEGDTLGHDQVLNELH